MSIAETYGQKFSRICQQTLFHRLPNDQRMFLRDQAHAYRFTLQELKRLCEIALDLNMWDEPSIMEAWPGGGNKSVPDKREKKRVIAKLHRHWEALKTGPTRYAAEAAPLPEHRIKPVSAEKERLGLGYCPVASEKTRCCNLLTLDAIESCSFDCSYCSIQSFYTNGQVTFDKGFADKLKNLQLDPGQTYHIGTGQSSDSLFWGNRENVLSALTEFARANPNVILELKTKSKNVAWLLENDVPSNIICTWSLNTPTLIAHEEHRTASLQQRLSAARQVADKGLLIGFHFHPMIHYDHWREEYAQLFQELLTGFKPSEVALVSLGTLTFTKKVVKQIRERGSKSKILQLPLTEADGKLSYPEAMKRELFTHAYRSLSPWHDEVFFYLCMENPRLWKPVLGREYPTNEDFEAAMKNNYRRKIEAVLRQRPAVAD